MNLIEIYPSIQGETTLSGHPTVFVRTAACNLRCSWCDTTYSFGRGTPWTIEEILKKIEETGLRYVCVTGGEPLLQENSLVLMNKLCDLGYVVSLETGGSLTTEHVDSRVRVILDIKCPGSGMSDKNDWKNLNHLNAHDEIKFVLLDREDYLWAIDTCKKYILFKHTVLFSPVHGKLNPQELVNWIVEDKIPVRLNLQIHKYIWTPETKGV